MLPGASGLLQTLVPVVVLNPVLGNRKAAPTPVPYLVGHILVATLVGAAPPSRWLHWAPLGCPTGWLLAVLVLGFCCPEVQPV